VKAGRPTATHGQPLAARRRAVAWLAAGLLGSGAPSAAWAASPEQRLVEIYRLIDAEQLWPALDRANALVRDVPNFRLAQLVRADLMRAMNGSLAAFGAPGEQAAHAAELQPLREEARLRLGAYDDPPPAGRVPRNFVALPSTTRHAIAVDASRARLYLFSHVNGGLQLMEHHYVSLGRSGVDKLIEGDQRTPLGVYFVTNKLGSERLMDFYGPGALPLNYPNAYDRLRGRTGSGIWLHGVPRENYARPPQATDGCVVLANEDFARLLRTVSSTHTPVVIAQRLEWVKPNALDGERKLAQSLLTQWQHALSAPQQRTSVYTDAAPAGHTVSVARAVKVAYTAGPSAAVAASRRPSVDVAVRDLSVLSYKDNDDLIVMTFNAHRADRARPQPTRQYWVRTTQGWKIAFEGSPG
jgi:L,D-transpeptidase catalytic domain